MSSPGQLAPFPMRLHKSQGPTGVEKELSQLLQRHMISGGTGDRVEGRQPTSLKHTSPSTQGALLSLLDFGASAGLHLLHDGPTDRIQALPSSCPGCSQHNDGHVMMMCLRGLRWGSGNAADSQRESQPSKKEEMLVSSACFPSQGLISPPG